MWLCALAYWQLLLMHSLVADYRPASFRRQWIAVVIRFLEGKAVLSQKLRQKRASVPIQRQVRSDLDYSDPCEISRSHFRAQAIAPPRITVNQRLHGPPGYHNAIELDIEPGSAV